MFYERIVHLKQNDYVTCWKEPLNEPAYWIVL